MNFFIANFSYAQVPANSPSRNTFLAIAETNGVDEVITTNSKSEIKAAIPAKNAEAAIPFDLESKGNLGATLKMKGYDVEYIRDFTFKNTSSASCTINSVDFQNADNQFEFLSIEPGASLPLDVAPGATFTVRVGFHAIERNKEYHNLLFFVTEQSKDPILYPIQAYQQPLSEMPWNQKKKK
jgi:hypothetical protein